MPSDAKPSLTPKLRFPEFRDGPGWTRTKLSSVLTDHGLTSDGKSDVHSVSLTKGIVPQIEHMGRSFAATDTGHYSLVRPFDIVYTRSPLAIFKLGIVKQHKRTMNAIVSPLYGVFTPKNRHLGLIIEAYFESPCRSIHYLDPLAQKGAKNTIQLSNERFLSGSLFLPDNDSEQQKIAECLSTLDELIGAESQKLDALKAHKKGLMQQLFPREGETLPRLRFPEFQNAPKWEIKTLSVVAENLDNKRVPITEKDRERGEIPYYGASGVVDYVKDYLFDENLLCVSEDGANLVARTYPIAFPISGKTWVNNHAHVLRFEDGATQKLVEDYLNSTDLRDFITGMAQPKLNKAMLDSIPVPLPQPPEQERIANCLSSLDDLIAAQSAKLEALKTHKQGLMQQLFPSPSEAAA